MLFFQGAFLILLGVTALAFAVGRSVRSRVFILLTASYVFYGAWDWRFLFLMGGSTALDFFIGRALPTASPARRKLLLAVSLVGNLGALAVFKYLDFGIETLRTLFGVDWPLLELTLPVGISFYTFQSMSYTIDIYRGELEPEPDFARLALFVSFFPQLVAGPIVRASTFLPQMQVSLGRFPNRVLEAVPLFVLGLFKKVVIADQLALIVEPVYQAPLAHGAADIALATLAFAGQIYGDFSGYTDMALALAALFGFTLPPNFASPYLATGPRDFWRRWHISLSTWLRDYLYIPLGGSRQGRARMYVALAATMLLGGLWHGAAVTFVAWGAYHGALLVAERALRASLPRMASALAPLGTVLFFPITLFGWMLFRADSAANLRELVAGLGRFAEPSIASPASVWLACCVGFLAIEHAAGEWARRTGFRAAEHPYLSFALAGAFLLMSVVLRPSTSEPFLYFQF